ncbi:GapR family DNA-binding domain-containing protein [Paracoccus sp. ME4]|uniref:GapR family DNA-binding domain-containing protein n=1 Tax=Paracoccus sp. ME4 TaxID=3138066 RepID=UPI00398A78A1
MSDPNPSEELIRQHVSVAGSYMDEAEELATRKKEWKAEVKGLGLDPALIEKVAKLKRADPDKISEDEAIFDIYKRAEGL